MNPNAEVIERTELTADFAQAFQRLALADDAPATLAECIDTFERMMKGAGVTVSVEQMFQSEPTRHAVHLEDRVEYLPCVLDALITGVVVDSKRVVIQSEPPNGDRTVILHVYDGWVDVLPPTAVFSIGLAATDTHESAPESLNKETAISMGSCAYINAFRDETEYGRWKNQQSDAAVLQLNGSEMFSLARKIANGPLFTGKGE